MGRGESVHGHEDQVLVPAAQRMGALTGDFQPDVPAPTGRTSTEISLNSRRDKARQSKPGPRLADVAGTRTRTLVPGPKAPVTLISPADNTLMRVHADDQTAGRYGPVDGTPAPQV